MRGLEQRIAALEQRVGRAAEQLDVIIVSHVRPGPTGPIEQTPTGYVQDRWSADARQWDRQPGETLDQLKERAKREATRGPGGVAVLRECYTTA